MKPGRVAHPWICLVATSTRVTSSQVLPFSANWKTSAGRVFTIDDHAFFPAEAIASFISPAT
jgi:hypothetical protein